MLNQAANAALAARATAHRAHLTLVTVAEAEDSTAAETVAVASMVVVAAVDSTAAAVAARMVAVVVAASMAVAVAAAGGNTGQTDGLRRQSSAHLLF